MPSQDDSDDEMGYDSGGMRGMSLGLAFMCMLTITQVVQVRLLLCLGSRV